MIPEAVSISARSLTRFRSYVSGRSIPNRSRKIGNIEEHCGSLKRMVHCDGALSRSEQRLAIRSASEDTLDMALRWSQEPTFAKGCGWWLLRVRLAASESLQGSKSRAQRYGSIE
jgi:hypothetical protein